MQNSDDVAFTEFVACRHAALLRTATLLTGDREAGRDLLQTALARTYLRWRKVDNPEAYVRRVLVTTRAGLLRRKRFALVDADRMPELAGPDPGPETDARVSLWPLVRALPPRQRAVVVLRYYEDLSEAETAELLGCSVGTVKSQAARALAKLRSALEDMQATAAGEAEDSPDMERVPDRAGVRW